MIDDRSTIRFCVPNASKSRDWLHTVFWVNTRSPLWSGRYWGRLLVVVQRGHLLRVGVARQNQNVSLVVERNGTKPRKETQPKKRVSTNRSNTRYNILSNLITDSQFVYNKLSAGELRTIGQ